jgi:nicotinamidase/pyrazinamidase
MTSESPKDLGPHDAVVAVDVQVDFCPGGALAIRDGDAVVPLLNRWISAAHKAGACIVVSRDWHPAGHMSFVERGGPWPPHCIQATRGADLHPDVVLPEDAVLVAKGTDIDSDQYSAFDGTGLAERLRHRGVRRIWIGGLAQDVCVRAAALDAGHERFEVNLIVGATRPVNRLRGQEALQELLAAGVRLERKDPSSFAASHRFESGRGPLQQPPRRYVRNSRGGTAEGRDSHEACVSDLDAKPAHKNRIPALSV